MAPSPASPKNFHVFDKDLDQETTQKFSKKRILAIDTEEMGLMHGRDRLCLVQICDSKDNVACIRISIGQKSAPRLKSLMENYLVEKVY